MSLGHPHWRGRRKRATRRVAHDLRLLAPMIALAVCLAGSATAILVVHRVPPTRHASPGASDGPGLAGAAPARDAAGCPAAPRGVALRSGG